MIIENSKIINDLVTFCPKSFKDNRGYFSEIYQKNIYKKELKIDFVQDNTSFSKKILLGVFISKLINHKEN